MKTLFWGLLISCCLNGFPLESFEKVVIWGHKEETHTHHYIHGAFMKAFSSLGYPTYWFDDKDKTDSFDFSDALFLTEGQVDGKIPLRNDCKYVLHNSDSKKYDCLEKRNRMKLQVYTDDVLSRPSAVKVAPCIYYDLEEKVLYMPWATDLLPWEIDEVKAKVGELKKEARIYWIGTIGEGIFGNKSEIDGFAEAGMECGIEFIHLTPGMASFEKNKELIQRSFLAPTIVGPWQKAAGYIPCRIFKNISYGTMALTNSQRVYELFEGKIVYNPNPYQLFYDAKKRMETISNEEILDIMDFVKEKHTYLNRIQTILDFFKLLETQ